MGKYFNKDKNDTESAPSTEFDVRNGVLFKYKGNSKTVNVPGNVAKIDAGAFSGCGLFLS